MLNFDQLNYPFKWAVKYYEIKKNNNKKTPKISTYPQLQSQNYW